MCGVNTRVIRSYHNIVQDNIADVGSLTDWSWCFAPSSRYRVNIGTADTATFNLDIDVIIAEGLRFKLQL